MAWRSYADASRMDRLTCAPTRETAARQQWRVTVESPELAARIFDRLRPLLVGAMVEGGRGGGQSLGASGGGGGGGWDGVVASAIGCAPNLRLYRYEVGDAFGRHVDESGEVPGGGVTALTVLIYLNGGGGGGSDGRGGTVVAHGGEWGGGLWERIVEGKCRWRAARLSFTAARTATRWCCAMPPPQGRCSRTPTGRRASRMRPPR